MYQKIKEYFKLHRDELLNSIMDVIRIPSVNGEELPDMPFGKGNARVLSFVQELAVKMGMKAEILENKVMYVDLNNARTELDILAHLDVVPPGEGWTVTNAFEPVIKEGRLYGRGASDDKGPAIAALYAMSAVKNLGIPLKKNVRLILGADEETGCRDTECYYRHYQEAPCSFSPDAEYPLINVEKGGLYTKYNAKWKESEALPRILSLKGGTVGNVIPNRAEAVIEGIKKEVIEAVLKTAEDETEISFELFSLEKELQYRIRATGRSAHASTPWEGKNAVTGLIHAILKLPLVPCEGLTVLKGLAEIFPHKDYYGNAAGVAQKDEISGELTIGTNVIDYQLDGLVGRIDCRAPICATKENVLDVLTEKLFKIGIELAPESKMTPPHYVPEESSFIQSLLSCYETVMGEKGYCMAIGGGTYAHYLKNGVAFGCMKLGTDYHMHGADEFLIIDEIIKSAELFALAISEICGK